jgi:hypothetical protein
VIDVYLGELVRHLHVRGRARRRFLAEAREHLSDLAAAVGPDVAVDRFGAAADVAAEFDLACATGRAVRAGWAAGAGILATGGSTLYLINVADAGVRAPAPWAVVFFFSAQVAAVCAGLVVLQALRLRRNPDAGGGSGAADVALLQRRVFVGLAAATLTMFAAGAALPGQGDALPLLLGPVLAIGAGLALVRSWLLNRRLPGVHERVDRPPVAELASAMRLPSPRIGPIMIAALAAACAVLRDVGERDGTLVSSLVAGMIEAAMVLVAYASLRRPLGLRTD